MDADCSSYRMACTNYSRCPLSRHDCKYLSMVSVYANTEHARTALHSCYINTKLLGRNDDVDDEIITASTVSIEFQCRDDDVVQHSSI